VIVKKIKRRRAAKCLGKMRTLFGYAFNQNAGISIEGDYQDTQSIL
jgi:hypothetical protein